MNRAFRVVSTTLCRRIYVNSPAYNPQCLSATILSSHVFNRKQSAGQPAQLLTKRSRPLLLRLFSQVCFTPLFTHNSHMLCGKSSAESNYSSDYFLHPCWHFSGNVPTHTGICNKKKKTCMTPVHVLSCSLCVRLRDVSGSRWIRRGATILSKSISLITHSLRGSVRLREGYRQPEGREEDMELKCGIWEKSEGVEIPLLNHWFCSLKRLK